jgi:hypothetical protein
MFSFMIEVLTVSLAPRKCAISQWEGVKPPVTNRNRIDCQDSKGDRLATLRSRENGWKLRMDLTDGGNGIWRRLGNAPKVVFCSGAFRMEVKE